MLFFAYGSLVNRDRLMEICPDAAPLRPATIPHHRICFTGRSERWAGGTATIGLAPATDLWGGLYEVNGADRARIEARGEETGYVWVFTSVEDVDGHGVQAGLLVKVRDLERSSPSQDYLEVLKAGWIQWGWDPEEILRHVTLS